jgi:hypothetical protein
MDKDSVPFLKSTNRQQVLEFTDWYCAQVSAAAAKDSVFSHPVSFVGANIQKLLLNKGNRFRARKGAEEFEAMLKGFRPPDCCLDWLCAEKKKSSTKKADSASTNNVGATAFVLQLHRLSVHEFFSLLYHAFVNVHEFEDLQPLLEDIPCITSTREDDIDQLMLRLENVALWCKVSVMEDTPLDLKPTLCEALRLRLPAAITSGLQYIAHDSNDWSALKAAVYKSAAEYNRCATILRSREPGRLSAKPRVVQQLHQSATRERPVPVPAAAVTAERPQLRTDGIDEQQQKAAERPMIPTTEPAARSC